MTFQENKTNQFVEYEKTLKTFFPPSKEKDLRNLGKYEDDSERLKKTKLWAVRVIHILIALREDRSCSDGLWFPGINRKIQLNHNSPNLIFKTLHFQQENKSKRKQTGQ